MNKNPFVNAILAASYIVIIVSVISSFERFADQPDTIMAPIIMLSLLVLSAAVMGFLFLSKPIQLLLENQKPQAISFFGKTVGIFAGFVLLFAVIMIIAS